MYKIIIVDDDSAFLNQFYDIVDWETYQMEVVEKLYNSEEVIKYIANNNVSAIITDICMPGKSGIDIAEFVKKNFPEIKVVFFSAFRSFEYAAEAIKYDVVGYITKPVSYAQLTETLIKLQKSLSHEHTSRFICDDIIKRRAELIGDFCLMKDVSADAIKEKMNKCEINNNLMYMACLLRCFSIKGLSDFLQNTWKYGEQSFFEATKRLMCYETGSYYSIPIYMDLNTIVIAFLTKKQDKSFYDMESEASLRIKEAFDLWIECDKKEDWESLLQMSLDDGNNSSVLQSVNLLLKNARRNNPDDSNGTINDAKNYIKENIGRNITLDEVAAKAYMQPSVFSRFFKRNTGTRFVDYINKERIEKAKNMISEGKTELNDLPNLVGYNSRAHFYKMFKYYTGVTPVEYRRRVMMQESRNDN